MFFFLSNSNSSNAFSFQIERVRANEQKTKDEAQQNNNYWFGGWFGIGASSAAVNPKTAKVVKSLQAEMTPDDKEKLYSAIGYQENAVPVKYPKTFIENRFEFFLRKLVILLRDHTNRKEPVILLSSLSRVEAIVEQRPAAQALRATVKVGGFIIDGTLQKTGIPSLVRPLEGTYHFLYFIIHFFPNCEFFIIQTIRKSSLSCTKPTRLMRAATKELDWRLNLC